MEIIIDGRELKLPTDIESTTEGIRFYRQSLTTSMSGFGAPGILDNGSSVGDLGNKLRKDPNHLGIIADALRAGSVQIEAWCFEHLSTALTRMLNETGESLELIDKRDPEQVRAEIEDLLEERRSSDYTRYETRLGSNLTDGLLVFRGNVDKIQNLRGGTLFVEGDVKQIELTESGIIFVDGNVETLDEAGHTIVMITGQLGKYTENRHHYQHRNTLRAGSPYIFASQIGEVDKRLYKGQGNDLLPQLDYPMKTDLSSMKGSNPKEATEMALTMAKCVATRYAWKILNLSQGALNARDLAVFARSEMFAAVLGR